MAIAVVTATVYAPIRSHGFINLDDPQYVSANPIVIRGLTWDNVRWSLIAGNGFYWHPLTWLSHMLDVQLFGLDAGAHHLMSVAMHVASAVLLFGALNRMTGTPGRSAFVAGLFALHPLRVESVAWIAERKDVLSTLFWMLTVWLYLDYVTLPRRRRMAAVMIAFAGALMSKPMVVTLPFVLLLLDYWPLRRAVLTGPARAWWPLIREKLPLFALAIGGSIVTLVMQRDAGAVVSLERLPLNQRFANAVVSYVLYLRDMIWPAKLAVFYPFVAPSFGVLLFAALFLIASAIVAWRLRTRIPYMLVGLLWYLSSLLPVIGIIQAGGQGRADRFTYVPMIGIFIVVAWGIAELAKTLRLPKVLLPIAAVATLAACVAITARQLSYWHDNVSLWARAVAVTNENYRAENHLGAALDDHGRIAEAMEHYRAALRIWPDYPEAHNNLGTAYSGQGNNDGAIKEFSEAVRIKPNDATFRYNLAAVLDAGGRKSEAIEQIRMAIRLRPNDPNLIKALATIQGGDPP